MDEEMMVEDVEIDPATLKDFPLPVERVISNCPSVTERYYEVRYFIPSADLVKRKGAGDQVILFHSNRMCLISLAPSHEVLKFKKTIVSVDFVGSHDAGNRLKNKVSGKFKKGGQKLKEDSILCVIKCDDGSSHSVLSGMKGSLIEINERLVDKPDLLAKQPWSDGFIALQFSSIPAIKHIKETMLKYEDYQKALDDRESKVSSCLNEITAASESTTVATPALSEPIRGPD